MSTRMRKRLLTGMAVTLLWAMAAVAGADREVTYQPGDNRDGGLTVAANEIVAITISGDAAESGDIVSVDASGVLTITSAGNHTLSLRGDNTGFLGTVEFGSGVLNLREAGNLIGSLGGLKFRGSASSPEAGWPVLEVDTGAAIVFAGDGVASATPANRLVVDADQAGVIRLLANASLTIAATNHDVTGSGYVEAFGGAISQDTGAALSFAGTGADAGAALTFSANQAAGTSTSAGFGYGYGGAISGGGTFQDIQTLTFSANQATGTAIGHGFGYGYGGAISGSGTFQDIQTLTFSANQAAGTGTGTGSGSGYGYGYGYGGAISGGGTFQDIQTLTFSANQVTGTGTGTGYGYGSGGAIHGDGIFQDIHTLTFSGNQATGSSSTYGEGLGGAIYARGEDSLTIATGGDVIFAGNRATGSYAAYGGAIYTAAPTPEFTVAGGKTMLFTGNTTQVGANAAVASSVYFNASSGARHATIDTAAGGLLDMRDPMDGLAENNALNLVKNGAGVWKLGGDNVFIQNGTGATEFTVNDGTLHLYRAAEVANRYATTYDSSGTPTAWNNDVAAGAIHLQGSGSTFTLVSGATLSVGGGNAITITSNAANPAAATPQGTITLGNNAVLSFDLAHHDPTPATPMLNLKAATFTLGPNLGIDLQSINKTNGTYTLVTKNTGSAGDFTTPTRNLTLRGEAIAGTRADSKFTASATADTIQVNQTGAANAVVTWAGGSGDTWNITSSNWSGPGINQFLHGDIVNFTNTAAAAQTIVVNAGGVQAAGMYLSGAGGYSFTGGGIVLDGDAGTFTGGNTAAETRAANGRLVLGAAASGTSPNSTITQNSFTGTVDFTGITGHNDFRGGVDLYSGTLRISNKNQLGTDLSGLRFLGDGSVPTLAIARNARITVNGLDSATHRITVEANKAGRILLEDNASLTITAGKEHQTGSGNINAYGGAISLNPGAALTVAGTGADAGASLTFSANQAVGTAPGSGLNLGNGYGGAISGGASFQNIQTLTFSANQATGTGSANGIGNGGAIFGDVSFQDIQTLTFSANQAIGSGYGGAILAATLEIATGGDVIFSGNRATGPGSAFGGAIYSENAPLTLTVAGGKTMLFTGNTSQVGAADAKADSIYFGVWQSSSVTATVTTEAGGLLDMRDPMGGEVWNSNTLTLTKDGAGVWKLGGDNVFIQSGAGATEFAVNAGTLHLYRAGEVANRYATQYDANDNPTAWNDDVAAGSTQLAGPASSFSLATGATLSLGGGNAITTAGTATIAAGSTLAFDIANYVPAVTGLTLSAPALTITNGTASDPVLNFAVDLSSFAAGTYTLLDTVMGSHLANLDLADANRRLTLGGQALSGRYYAALVTTTDDILVLTTGVSANLGLTWSGGRGGVWTAADNWLGDVGGDPETFVNGDAVTFTDAGQNQEVTLSGTVEVADMTITGGDYTFTGGAIDSTGAVTGTGVIPGQKLTISGGSAVFNTSLTFANGGTVADADMVIGASAADAGSMFTGPLRINDGARLAGCGGVSGDVTVASGGTLDALADGGALTITGNLSMAAGAALDVSATGSPVVVLNAAVLAPGVDVRVHDATSAGQPFAVLNAGTLSWTDAVFTSLFYDYRVFGQDAGGAAAT